MELVLVLIIAHKEKLNNLEKASLKQCLTVLKNYPIKLICPKGLNVNEYKNIDKNIQVDFINPRWQSNYSNFNRLKINPLLYKRYKKYSYILFYELDAWVFKDKLEHWCGFNYDYIGAPWFEGYNVGDSQNFLGVGNGGFSLRKVESCLKIQKSFKYIESPIQIFRKKRQQPVHFLKTCRFIFALLLDLTIRNNFFYLFNNYKSNEDIFWSTVVSEKFSWYKVAPLDDARKFSFEKHPDLLYEMNDKKLPFGCHGWWKYNFPFWKSYIDITK